MNDVEKILHNLQEECQAIGEFVFNLLDLIDFNKEITIKSKIGREYRIKELEDKIFNIVLPKYDQKQSIITILEGVCKLNDLAKDQEDLDSDFAEVINEHFWDII